MCGIAGVINNSVVSENDIEKMLNTINYRGVDEKSVERIGPAVLGHVRLAVVDPENGTQPMPNEDGTVWVTFNGEIYNYVELRNELKKKGHVFKSRCDTEVLVHLWEEEGERMLDRLIGMFAFFLWDTNQQKGILARDRQGIKPCFISNYNGGIAFCSEIKGLLSLPDFIREINDDALSEVFSFNYAIPPHTCFKGVNHLEPGSYILFDGNNEPITKKYWNWPFFDRKKQTTFEEYNALMDDSTRMQMRFDVEGGMYLSGGVDSSVVGSHLKKQWKQQSLNAIGLNFTESEFSEYHYSKEAAEILDINLEEAIMSWEIIPEVAQKVSYHAEQPHGDFSFFLFYALARKAHNSGKIVMFTGDGPDEALLGFLHNERYFHDQQRMNFSLKNYFNVICYMSSEIRQRVLSESFEKNSKDPAGVFEDIIEPWSDLEPIEQIMAYECTALMPGNNLVKGDRMGACWSIEGRSPFLDHRVAESFTRLPINQKFHDGYGKYFLKNYACETFPTDFIFKDKQMPTTPIGEWLKGPLYSWAKELLASNTNHRFNTSEMIKLLDEHKDGLANYTRELRTLIMTQLWLQNFFANTEG